MSMSVCGVEGELSLLHSRAKAILGKWFIAHMTMSNNIVEPRPSISYELYDIYISMLLLIVICQCCANGFHQRTCSIIFKIVIGYILLFYLFPHLILDNRSTIAFLSNNVCSQIEGSIALESFPVVLFFYVFNSMNKYMFR